MPRYERRHGSMTDNLNEKSVRLHKWPKMLPPLDQKQEEIRRDFMLYWHKVLPNKFGWIDRINHKYVMSQSHHWSRTLEIGGGLGSHLRWENLEDEKAKNYYVVEVIPDMAAQIQREFIGVHVFAADCQEALAFPNDFFDRVLAIHVLEHLPNLPAAISNIHRVLDKEIGQFIVMIPCEGGLAYTTGRRFTTKRLFERRYKQPYDWFISREHLNRPHEIIEELQQNFILQHKGFFPMRLPIISLNLVIGLSLRPRGR